MALRNLFGEVSLESTQLDIKLDSGELLLDVLKQLRIMNVHLQAISGEKVDQHDIQEDHNVD